MTEFGPTRFCEFTDAEVSLIDEAFSAWYEVHGIEDDLLRVLDPEIVREIVRRSHKP